MTTTAINNETRYTFANLNDTQKQQLVERMLSDHPLRLNNSIVQYILGQDDYENAPFTREDITNNEYYGSVEVSGSWEELTEEERDEKLPLFEHLESRAESVMEKLEELQNDADGEEWNVLEEKINRWSDVVEYYQEQVQNLNDMDFDEQPEIYQWFSCSDWLIRELESKGQCTLDGEFWGRQACGQSVTLDCVMQEIAFEYACDYGKDTLSAEQFYTIR